MVERPKMKSESEKELDKVQAQLDNFSDQVKELTQDRMNEAPKLDVEAQTKISQKQLDKMPEHYLKPIRTIGCKEKFNEKFWTYLLCL